jgi:hypothetical protein
MRHVTHNCGMYCAAASIMLVTPNHAAQILAVEGLCATMMIVIIAPSTKNERFAIVTDTAVRYVGGVYSERNISEGRGIWCPCSS